VTLGRLVLAWLPVALVFAGLAEQESVFTKWNILWRSLEAAAVTLLASLWFDSLGHGGWWLLFALLGLIVSLARLRGATTPVAGTPEGGWRRREALIRAGRDVARYVLAGAILAWRLG